MVNLRLFHDGAINDDPITTWTPPALTPAAPSAPVTRWFVRCQDCLSVAAVTELPHASDWKCAACDGHIENMGRVERDRLVHDHIGSPCDERCTNARGPRCDCHCHGQNHGTRRTVRVIRDAGAVPRVNMPQPEQARRIAQAYHEARERVRAELDTLTTQRRAGYLPPADFARMRRIESALRTAYAARTHASRMRALTAALAR